MNYFTILPEELLFILFSYLDKKSKLVATEVCRDWKLKIHDMSWKSILRLAGNDNAIKKDFSMFGWMEDEHEFGECKCIQLHLDHYPFKNTLWALATHSNTNSSRHYNASTSYENVVLE